MAKTEYLQGDDAQWFLREGYCEACLRPAREWAEENRFGHVEVHGAYDSRGNLCGFLCPQCAGAEKVPPSCECPYCGEDHIAPDDDNFCFCLRCKRYYYVGD